MKEIIIRNEDGDTIRFAIDGKLVDIYVQNDSNEDEYYVGGFTNDEVEDIENALEEMRGRL